MEGTTVSISRGVILEKGCKRVHDNAPEVLFILERKDGDRKEISGVLVFFRVTIGPETVFAMVKVPGL
tara:strand:- start:1767 stop:1970 length:204 start_codon:yes stop_codon:yes gene_type:complete